ncbi:MULTISPECIES: hypothetical protein [Photobacterium]|uniref:hypothetical protein n=1 Tax=Photobacterium TaxID=657 RepID=UPI001C2D5BBE|nr:MULTISPECIES: hypothetical protein [Photobacterium]MBV1843122.1 hypothetical protein [Photobacterium ganghwense]
MINVKGSWLLLLLLVGGCAEKVGERNGTTVDVFPISYSVAIKSSSDSQLLLDTFWNDHRHAVLSQGITIQWISQRGKTLAAQIQNQFIKKGVAREQIKVIPGIGEASRFDVVLGTTGYTARVGLCEPMGVGMMGRTADGCITENARWASMVNPQKMLASTVTSTSVSE